VEIWANWHLRGVERIAGKFFCFFEDCHCHMMDIGVNGLECSTILETRSHNDLLVEGRTKVWLT
jgi:hypothetical protein